MPGQVSVRTPPVRRVGWGEGPVGRMRSRQRADTRKLAALNRSAATAPTAWAASPANPRPAIAATEAPLWSRALPATSSAAVTREGRQTWYAVAKKTLAVPASSATTTSWPVLSTPSQAPAGRPITSHGRYAAAVRAATAKVLARRTVTAASGTPTTAIELPAPLIVSPIHSSRKFRCPDRPPGLAGLDGLTGLVVGTGLVGVTGGIDGVGRRGALWSGARRWPGRRPGPRSAFRALWLTR